MPTSLPTPAEPTRFLSDGELEALERDGVVRARGLVDAATIEHLRDALEDAIEKLSVLSSGLDQAGDGFRGDIFVWKLRSEFRDLALYPQLGNRSSDQAASRGARCTARNIMPRPRSSELPGSGT